MGAGAGAVQGECAECDPAHGCLACRRVELANFEFSSNGAIARTTSDLPTTLPVNIPGVLDPDTNGVSMVHCEALIDSGASHSLIDPQLAERLNPTCLTGRSLQQVRLADGRVEEAM